MRSLLLAVLLVLAATLTAACGQDEERTGLLAQGRATDLKAELADVETAVEAGSCVRVDEELGGLRRMLEELPPRTDAELRERLQEGIAQLEQLAPVECEEQTTETQPDTTTETTPTEPPVETTPPEPPPETTPTEPPAETVPPPVEELPGGEEGEEGGAGDEQTPGNGNGNGPPGGIPPGQAGGEEAPGGR